MNETSIAKLTRKYQHKLVNYINGHKDEEIIDAIKNIKNYLLSSWIHKFKSGTTTGPSQKAAAIYTGLEKLNEPVNEILAEAITESIYIAIGLFDSEKKKVYKEIGTGNIIKYIENISIWKILSGLEERSSFYSIGSNFSLEDIDPITMSIIDDLLDKTGIKNGVSEDILEKIRLYIYSGQTEDDKEISPYISILKEAWNNE